MTTPRSAPPGPGRPASRPPGLPPLPGAARAGGRPSLTRAQQTRLRLVCGIVVLVGVLGGLLATVVLPHIYGARVYIVYNLGSRSSSSSLADSTLTTQALLITSAQVLGPVASRTNVPIDYLMKNVKADVVANTNPGTADDNVPDSEVLQVQVNHPDRQSGVEIANEVAKQYLQVASGDRDQLQAQLDNAQRQLADPTTPPDAAADLQSQITDLQTQLSQSVQDGNLATLVGPAYSQTAPVFPNTLLTLAIGALVGVVAASVVGLRLVRGWTRR